VLKWYSAYCRPGTLTTGFNAWVLREEFSENNSRLAAEIKLFSQGQEPGHFSFVACMNPNFDYEVRWNDQPVPAKQSPVVC